MHSLDSSRHRQGSRPGNTGRPPNLRGRGLAPDSLGYLHNAVAANANHDAKRAALDLDLDLDLLLILISGAPLNHAGRTQA
ncbi:hypothetical protein PspCFBP13528_17085 [Pseudomonas sp. CFBP13528]|nr:hypothetical protein PspCFBP13528_17085 [Pseudomonas sp. CFBP13528]